MRRPAAIRWRRSSAHQDSGLSGAADSAATEDDEVFVEEDDSPLEFPEPEVVSYRRRRRWGVSLVLVGLVLLAAVTAILYFSPLLTIRTVEVERNDLLTDERAQELLQPVVGSPLPQVGNSQVEELLAEEPVVDDVVVQGQLPDTLRVEIIEHPPVAEVHDGDEIIFFNEYGDQIRVFREEESDDAEGYATPEISSEAALQNQAVFRTIAAVLGELPLDAREVMESATADSIDSVQLILDDGRTINWGSAEDSEQKAAVLEAILVSEAEDFTSAEVIDISTPDAPVTR